MDNNPQPSTTPADNTGSSDAPVNPVVRRPITIGGTSGFGSSMDGVVRRSAVVAPQPEPQVEPQAEASVASEASSEPAVTPDLVNDTSSAPIVPTPEQVAADLSASAEPTSEPVVTAPEVASADTPAQTVPSPAEPTAIAPEPTPSADAPVSLEATPAPAAAITPSEKDESPAPGAVVTPPLKSAPKGRKGTGAAIVIGILFTVALIGGAGYAYWQNSKNKAPAAQTEQTTEEQKTVQPATADDIQKASDDIDAALNKVDDTKDFVESDLSDATLGL